MKGTPGFIKIMHLAGRSASSLPKSLHLLLIPTSRSVPVPATLGMSQQDQRGALQGLGKISTWEPSKLLHTVYSIKARQVLRSPPGARGRGRQDEQHQMFAVGKAEMWMRAVK